MLTQKLGASEADLDKYRMSSLVPLMPDLFVGDPGALEKWVEGGKKAQSLMGAMGKFMGKK